MSITEFGWMTAEEFRAAEKRDGDHIMIRATGTSPAYVGVYRTGQCWSADSGEYAILRPKRPTVSTVEAIAHVVGGGSVVCADDGSVSIGLVDGGLRVYEVHNGWFPLNLSAEMLGRRWHLEDA